MAIPTDRSGAGQGAHELRTLLAARDSYAQRLADIDREIASRSRAFSRSLGLVMPLRGPQLAREVAAACSQGSHR